MQKVIIVSSLYGKTKGRGYHEERYRKQLEKLQKCKKEAKGRVMIVQMLVSCLYFYK